MIPLIRELEAIAESVFERKLREPRHDPTPPSTPETIALREKLAQINAKEFISIGETALLLNCSGSHVRNLIGKARKRQTERPIPFIDLDGVTVFNRVALLKWTESSKGNSNISSKVQV